MRLPPPSVPFDGAASTAPTFDSKANRTPSCAIRAWTTAAASWSSRGRMCEVCSKTVTWLPKRANAWASSQPIGPAPMTAIRRGSVVSEKTVSLFR